MKNAQPYLFFLLSLLWCAGPKLRAQVTDPIRPALQHLQGNVFAIRTTFDDGTAEQGFGFLVGASGAHLYGVTAAHVVRHSADRATKADYSARFAATFDWLSLRVVRDWELNDLALVEMPRPLDFKLEPNCTDFESQAPFVVRFLGSWLEGEPQWLDLGIDGKIFSQDGSNIRFSLPTIQPGSSGAPLISAKGLVGMVLNTNGVVGSALSISAIARLLGQGQTQYFSLKPYQTATTVPISLPNPPDVLLPQMVKIPGGSFIRGCTPEQQVDCQVDEKPSQRVSVASFSIGAKEVTVAEFQAFVKAKQFRTDATKDGGSFFWNGRSWVKRPGINWTHHSSGELQDPADYRRFPVVHVSWNDAQAYCRWLSEKTGENYRLPTEAEWEYAARGGSSAIGTIYSGSDDPDEVGWFAANADGGIHPVGEKKPNPLGLYDLCGNVFEWCADGYGPYSATPVSNPRGAEGNQSKVTRGGSWLNVATECRTSYRHSELANFRAPHLGFRVAKSTAE